MKLSKSQLIQIIKEELQNTTLPVNEEWSSDPIELLEEIISEVQIDAGAYDEPKRSYRSGLEDTDRVRAQTAGNYLEPLNKLMKLNLGG